MKTALQPGEQITKEGPANLQKGIETVGGRLTLTDRRLLFEAHAFNVQGGVTELALSDVRATRLCWTMFLNLFPVFPNSLAVTSKAGAELRFVLWGREEWAAAIDAARGAATG